MTRYEDTYLLAPSNGPRSFAAFTDRRRSAVEHPEVKDLDVYPGYLGDC